MGFAADRHTASTKQLEKIRGLAAALGDGETLVIAMARDERTRSMRSHPKLLGHPIESDLAELSLFEASAMIDALQEACAERDAEPSRPAPTRARVRLLGQEEYVAEVETPGGTFLHSRPQGITGNKVVICRRVK